MGKILSALKKNAECLKYDLSALFIAYRRKAVPLSAKIAIAVTVCYALSPVDLIPDFIPILGCLDDIILVPLLIGLSIRLIPAEVLEECRKEAAGLGQRKPKRWYFAIPVILLWIIVILLLIKGVRGFF